MALDNAALLGVLEAMRAAGVEDRVRGFAQPLGYACATTETVVELDLLSANISPVQPPEGYTVATYLNGVPEHLRAQVGVLKGDRERGGTPTAPCSGTQPGLGGGVRSQDRALAAAGSHGGRVHRARVQHPPCLGVIGNTLLRDTAPSHGRCQKYTRYTGLSVVHSMSPRSASSAITTPTSRVIVAHRQLRVTPPGGGQELDKPWTRTCLASAKTRWRASSSAVDQSEPH